MSDPEHAANNEEQWQRQNEAYLSAALHWLRVRLERLGGPPEAPVREPQPAPARKLFFWRREESQPLPPRRAARAPSEADVERAASAMVEAEAADPPPALRILGSRFQLSRFEEQILLLCAALELFSLRLAAQTPRIL